ncbi:MAG: ParA family protein [Methylococcaceae bacterium]|nr:ParA family protein [Methylococcaceae bacterium]
MTKKITPAHYNRKLITCDGSKGGTGKSLIATTIASLLLRNNYSVTLIEADKTNPDIARRFGNYAPVLLAGIDNKDGWMSLLDEIENIDTQYIVMSMPAGLNEVNEISGLLARTLHELEIELHQVFCLSRQTDSLYLINTSIETGLAAFAQQSIAVKNGFFGKNEEFDRWNQSPTRNKWLSKGFQETFLPELNHRIIDFLETHPQPLHGISKKHLRTALWLDLQDWLGIAEQCFSSITIKEQAVTSAGD